MKKVASGLVMLLAVFLLMANFGQAAGFDVVVGEISVLDKNGQWEKTAKLEPGQLTTVRVPITNQGDKDINIPFVVELNRSPKRGMAFREIRWGSRNVLALAKGQTLELSFKVKVPMTQSVYYLWASADPQNQLKETLAERDNNRSRLVDIAAIVVGPVRSADACNRCAAWGLERKELQAGLAQYDYSPAALIVYAALENGINPLLLLAYLQTEQGLISWLDKSRDFDLALLKATGYGVTYDDAYRWYGFIAQLVSTSYQMKLYNDRDQLEYADAFLRYTGGEGDWAVHAQVYADYCLRIKTILGMPTVFAEQPNSNGYYFDWIAFAQFSPEAMIKAVQQLLEDLNSPLSDQRLFKKVPTDPTVVDYQTLSFCSSVIISPVADKKIKTLFDRPREAYDGR